jgi:hypothetical protein
VVNEHSDTAASAVQGVTTSLSRKPHVGATHGTST